MSLFDLASDCLHSIGWEKLCQSIAIGVFHHSEARYDAPRCSPGSHDGILKEIIEWLQDTKNIGRFLWIFGEEGCGKSMIAQTVADQCYQAGDLLVTFFFSNILKRGGAEHFFIPTIAYQLCVIIPEMRDIVSRVIDRDPAILTLSLPYQLRELVLVPLNCVLQNADVKNRLDGQRIAVIIDGLEVAGTGSAQRRILDTFAAAMHQSSLPFTFVIACRPEHHIRQAFTSEPLRSKVVCLPMDATDSKIYELAALPNISDVFVQSQVIRSPFLTRMAQGMQYSTSLLKPILIGFEKILRFAPNGRYISNDIVFTPQVLATYTNKFEKVYFRSTLGVPSLAVLHARSRIGSGTLISRTSIPETLFGRFIKESDYAPTFWKKALLIGIGGSQANRMLGGCHRNIQAIQDLLIGKDLCVI